MTRRARFSLRALMQRSELVGKHLPVAYDPAFADFQKRFSDREIIARKFAALKTAIVEGRAA